MYERILLAYDGSREGRAALREGALLAKRLGATVYLLSVASVTAGVRIADATQAGPVAQSRDAYRALFDEAMLRLREFGLLGEGRLVAGEPVKEVAAYAREVNADLVVVGHRKKSLLDRWWSGTTDGYLLDHLACSLLFARQEVNDEVFRAEMGDGGTSPAGESQSPPE